MNININHGMEIGLFQCEKSVRQIWNIKTQTQENIINSDLNNQINNENLINSNFKTHENGIIELKYNGTNGFNPISSHIDTVIQFCMGILPNRSRSFLRVINCDTDEINTLKFEFLLSGKIRDIKSGLCLETVGNNDIGGLLKLSSCSNIGTSQKEKEIGINNSQIFTYNEITGEILSFNNLCMTAGWPFLTATAFINELTNKISVIIMNEADIETEIILYDNKRNEEIKFGISERSIQTIVY